MKKLFTVFGINSAANSLDYRFRLKPELLPEFLIFSEIFVQVEADNPPGKKTLRIGSGKTKV
jgi:hypothetical protein